MLPILNFGQNVNSKYVSFDTLFRFLELEQKQLNFMKYFKRLYTPSMF